TGRKLPSNFGPSSKPPLTIRFPFSSSSGGPAGASAVECRAASTAVSARATRPATAGVEVFPIESLPSGCRRSSPTAVRGWPGSKPPSDRFRSGIASGPPTSFGRPAGRRSVGRTPHGDAAGVPLVAHREGAPVAGERDAVDHAPTPRQGHQFLAGVHVPELR